MINSVQLKNFGPLTEIDWQNLGPINLVIGNNGCGKSFLLKAMYSAVRTLESYKRGDNPKSAADILFEKLYWTFQSEKLGDLATKSCDDPLSFNLTIDQQPFIYSFNKDTLEDINSLKIEASPRSSDSIYLPAKEVLSLHHIILESRDRDLIFGFDDTYYDLAKALQNPLRGKFGQSIIDVPTGDPKEDKKIEARVYFRKTSNNVREILENILGGKIEYDKNQNRWFFKKGNLRFDIGVTAEGLKKISILDILLGNGYLDNNSIVFIDEPEAALHPEAITKLLDIIALLAQCGIQFFIASHSYFVVKKLFLIAQQQKLSIPVLSYENQSWLQSDLLHDFPDNPIIDESTRLFKEEVNLPT